MGDELLDVWRPYWATGEHDGLWPHSIHSQVYANSLIVKRGPGKLYGFQGYNSGAAQFILVCDALGVPADGSIPCFPIAVAATSNFSAFFGDTGRTFQTGIVLVNSSTAPTKTIGAADCFFDAQYI
jgi:hypothetical protein